MRHGAALEHGKAHDSDHKKWSRRNFLKGLGIGTGASMALGGIPLSATGASPLNYLLGNSTEERVLVLIRLGGGNDGLNMIVPLYQYDTYQANRPQIALPENQLLNLSNEFGMHGAMSELMPLWNEGQMKIVNSVGYPDQNLSHFTSTDIWSSANNVQGETASGWLGRFLENEYPDYILDPPANPPAIQIGSAGNITFNGSDANAVNYSVAVSNSEQLFDIALSGQLYSLEGLSDCYGGDQVAYMRTVANTTFRYSEVIKAAFDASANAVEYSTNLGAQLALVARLIKGGLGTKMYMVTLDGFDTHAGQLGQHQFLLNQIAGAVNNFYQDLGTRAKDVLSMTFSEFGRRIQQNASAGTDHGAAAPLMMFGEGLNGSGFVGENPDLNDLDNNGNLKYATDFREIYASVLENWLCIDGELVDNILGQSYNRIDLGLSCNTNVSTVAADAYRLKHEARYSRDGQIFIQYELPSTMYIKVEIFNMLGQPVALLHKGRQGSGIHSLNFRSENRYAPAQYIYRIEANGKAYSRQIAVM